MTRPISGHVCRVERKRGPSWYAKYRLPDGRQVQKRIGPAWTGRGGPPAGYFTERTAEDWLRDVLDQARAGTLPRMVRTGVTFAEAAEAYLTWLEVDRERKPSTLRDYRSILRTHMLPAFGAVPIEDLTPAQLDRWRRELDPALANRTTIKTLTLLYGILERARRTHGLPVNPARDIEKPTQRRNAGIDVFSLEEVMALVVARSASP